MSERSDRSIHLPALAHTGRIQEFAEVNLQAALGLVPIAGSFLSTYFGEVRSKRADERMRRYFAYFADRVDSLEESKLDKNYLNSEEFAELFVQGAERAARTTSEDRIRQFANVLANNAVAGPQARQRTYSVMAFLERMTDLDGFVLLAYGDPKRVALRAETKDDAIHLVNALAEYLGGTQLRHEDVIDAIVYMDNLGLTWVNEHVAYGGRRTGSTTLADFSSFRSPLGDTVANAIAPPDFYLAESSSEASDSWPDGHVSAKYGPSSDTE